jgi:Holliday junction DNA helicase RuvA
MIGRLVGHIVSDDAGSLVVDVNGVGYEVLVPMGTLGRAKHDDGRTILVVHTHVREDAFLLYGFASEADRGTFRTLIGVSNIGPKMALAVLGALPPSELARAVAGNDVKALSAIPGIGKKTAEKILFELKDKVLPLEGPLPVAAAAPAAKPSAAADLLLSALVNMGYRPSDAERAVTALGDRVQSAPMPVLVKEALQTLSK